MENPSLQERWDQLPSSVKTPTQIAGRAGIACGATHSIMERCNLSCTSCYLTELANRTVPLPFDEVREQLDRLRAYLGEGGKAQITSGEVTLLPLAELGRIVAYAREIGLDPMVMSNGVRFLQEPDYLLALVRDFGLGKLSFHVDATQRGLREWRPGLRERELHGLRDRLADTVRETRRRTGASLHAAHTVTLTNENVLDVPDVVAWMLDNVDAVRILSFQPVAPVGRTEDASNDLTLEAIWQLICQPTGRTLNRHAMHFGHPECNITVPLLVVRTACGNEVVEVVRANRPADERAFATLLEAFAPHVDLNRGVRHNARPVARALLRRPGVTLGLAVHALRRLWSERRLAWRGLTSLLRGRGLRIRPLLLVVHKFMSPEELATPVGQERLEACVFKLPVDGRMVSMCEMNATALRAEVNAERLRTRATVKAPAPRSRPDRSAPSRTA